MEPSRDFAELSQALLRLSALDAPRMEFLGLVSEALLDFSQADAVDVCLHERDRFFCVGVVHPRSEGTRGARSGGSEAAQVSWGCCNAADGEPCPALGSGGLACVRPALSVPDTRVVPGKPSAIRLAKSNDAGHEARSTVLGPFAVSAGAEGLMMLRTCRQHWFTTEQTELYASLAGLLGVAVAHQAAQRTVRVRARELSTLYRVARLVSFPDASLDETLSRIAQALPAGCPEPERVTARIVIDGRVCGSDEVAGAPTVTREVLLRGESRGFIQLGFPGDSAHATDEELLASVSRLLGGVAQQVATLVCRLQLRGENESAQRLLRHADRLATVGTLASGLGHELTEPLTAIVGFAELLHKEPGLSDQARRDIERIESASAHAREIVRRLMLLARQSPSGWQEVELNRLTEDALSFVEQRGKLTNVRVVKDLDPAVPLIVGDRTQLCQVVVNLVRNAIQAMPNGGEVQIQTRALPDGVRVAIEDNGVGMSDEVRARIFEPFFTTKAARDGMGLGLAVVHDIVSLHGGQIEVESAPGSGTRFGVRLPLAPPGFVPLREEADGGRSS